MNRAVEDPLREGLDRPTADVQIPPGVTGGARAHLRRKKIAARAALATGTAAVTAAAVLAATVPGQGTGGRPVQARTTALVITRVANALAAPNKVIQTEMIFSAAVPPVLEWNYRSDFRQTQSGYFPPALGVPWARGLENWGLGTAKAGGRRRWVQVDYRHHTWATGMNFGFPPYSCAVQLDVVEFNLPANWPAYIRRALSCGLFHLAGHAPANAVQAIRLTGSMTDRHFWSHLPHAPGRGPLRVDVTLYENPKIYLPMLVTWNNRTHYRDGRPLDGTVRDDITALPATPGNIAKANVTFPASFRKESIDALGNIILFPYFTVLCYRI